MKTDDPRRRFSREVKLAAVQRMAAGANISKLSRELGISRKGLYQWQKQFRAGRATALQDTGRPGRGMTTSPAQKSNDTSPSASIRNLRRRWRGLRNWSGLSGNKRLISIFSASLAARRESTPTERHAWRDGIYTVIEVMMASKLQGKISVERMCQLAGVSRAGYYRHWQATAPRREDNGLRDALQRLALAEPHYGYRRLGVLLRQKGWHANHKRVLRLMREDNLLCLRKSPFVPMTTNATHDWCIVPNLARGL